MITNYLWIINFYELHGFRKISKSKLTGYWDRLSCRIVSYQTVVEVKLSEIRRIQHIKYKILLLQIIIIIIINVIVHNSLINIDIINKY